MLIQPSIEKLHALRLGIMADAWLAQATKAELVVLIAQRWILARLRNGTSFLLAELNGRVAELLEKLNVRPVRKLGKAARCERHERCDRPALRPLPSEAYEMQQWERVRVNLNYRIEFGKRCRSLPHPLLHEQPWACATPTTVGPLCGGRGVPSHVRGRVPCKHTAGPAHMPDAQWHHSAGVDSVIAWATSVGLMTAAFVKRLLESNLVMETGRRSARRLQRIGERNGAERTEQGCTRALRFSARSYKPVERTLALGRENTPIPGDEPPEAPIIEHEDARWASYYH